MPPSSELSIINCNGCGTLNSTIFVLLFILIPLGCLLLFCYCSSYYGSICIQFVCIAEGTLCEYNLSCQNFERKVNSSSLAGIRSHRGGDQEVQTDQELPRAADADRPTAVRDWNTEKGIWEDVKSVTHGVTEHEKVWSETIQGGKLLLLDEPFVMMWIADMDRIHSCPCMQRFFI